MPKNCPACNTSNSDAARFCRSCATPLWNESIPRCPEGHVLSPGMSRCVICEAKQQRGSTVVEGDPAGGGSADPKPGPAPGPAPTPKPWPAPAPPAPPNPHRGSTSVLTGPGSSGGAAGGASRGATIVLASAAPASPGGPPDRKIVGVLISYTWQPGGRLYAVYEGRNRIGSAAENEISVADDTAMSRQNSFLIFHPHGNRSFLIDDANSQNGTFVDGHIVDERRKLHNYAKIRAGSTVFTFVSFDPETPAAEVEAEE